MNVLAGLTPASTPYLWIIDKFGNQYSDQITINGDGSFDIDLTFYPAGMFNPANGWFDIFISSDSAGSAVIPMVFESNFNCLKIKTICIDNLRGIGYDLIGTTLIVY